MKTLWLIWHWQLTSMHCCSRCVWQHSSILDAPCLKFLRSGCKGMVKHMFTFAPTGRYMPFAAMHYCGALHNKLLTAVRV
jgi:hypothetical protein